MTTYRRREGLPHQKIDRETLIVVPKERMSHKLDEVATHVWEELAAPRTLDALVGSVVEAFEVEPDRARADLKTHLARMVELGLVVRES